MGTVHVQCRGPQSAKVRQLCTPDQGSKASATPSVSLVLPHAKQPADAEPQLVPSLFHAKGRYAFTRCCSPALDPSTCERHAGDTKEVAATPPFIGHCSRQRAKLALTATRCSPLPAPRCAGDKHQGPFSASLGRALAATCTALPAWYYNCIEQLARGSAATLLKHQRHQHQSRVCPGVWGVSQAAGGAGSNQGCTHHKLLVGHKGRAGRQQ